jgi:COMPASS component SPP1
LYILLQSLRAQGSGAVSRRRKRGGDSDSDGETPATNVRLLSKAPRQCYGPACIQAAKQGSKYCSDECGMKLATNRIYQVRSNDLPPSQ